MHMKIKGWPGSVCGRVRKLGGGSSHPGWGLASGASRIKGTCILDRRDILLIQPFKSSERHLLKTTSSETGKCPDAEVIKYT